jgi:hypothetical protein
VVVAAEAPITASQAVVFFTGSVARIVRLSRNRAHIKAAGYYATIGA